MQSELATNLEKRQQGEHFRITVPPSLPQKPYSPDRFKLCLVGIALGVALALGLTMAIETIIPRIYREEDVHGLIPAPVLAAIPVLLTSAEIQKRRWYPWLEFSAAFLLLAIIPVVMIFAYHKG